VNTKNMAQLQKPSPPATISMPSDCDTAAHYRQGDVSDVVIASKDLHVKAPWKIVKSHRYQGERALFLQKYYLFLLTL
jgi:hypothetical protein